MQRPAYERWGELGKAPLPKKPEICKCGATMRRPVICGDNKRRHICPDCNHQRIARSE